MNDHFLTDIEALKTITPKPSVMAAIRATIDERKAQVAEPAPVPRYLSPIQIWQMPVFVAAALVLVLVFMNHRTLTEIQFTFDSARIAAASNALQKSMVAESTLYRSSLALATSQDVATDAAFVERATAQARATHDELKLKGDPGIYTMEDCLSAYRAYDQELDALDIALSARLQSATTPAAVQALERAQSVVHSAMSEAGARLGEYPSSASMN